MYLDRTGNGCADGQVTREKAFPFSVGLVLPDDPVKLARDLPITEVTPDVTARVTLKGIKSTAGQCSKHVASWYLRNAVIWMT